MKERSKRKNKWRKEINEGKKEKNKERKKQWK